MVYSWFPDNNIFINQVNDGKLSNFIFFRIALSQIKSLVSRLQLIFYSNVQFYSGFQHFALKMLNRQWSLSP